MSRRLDRGRMKLYPIKRPPSFPLRAWTPSFRSPKNLSPRPPRSTR